MGDLLSLYPLPPAPWIDLRTGQPTQPFYRYMIDLLLLAGGDGPFDLKALETLFFAQPNVSPADVEALRERARALAALRAADPKPQPAQLEQLSAQVQQLTALVMSQRRYGTAAGYDIGLRGKRVPLLDGPNIFENQDFFAQTLAGAVSRPLIVSNFGAWSAGQGAEISITPTAAGSGTPGALLRSIAQAASNDADFQVRTFNGGVQVFAFACSPSGVPRFPTLGAGLAQLDASGNVSSSYTINHKITVSATGDDKVLITGDTSTTIAKYLSLQPTDFAVGKPGFYLIKLSSATGWQIGLSDGASNTGTIDISVSTLTWNSNTVLTAANTGTSGHLLPYLDAANTWSATQAFSGAGLTGFNLLQSGAATSAAVPPFYVGVAAGASTDYVWAAYRDSPFSGTATMLLGLQRGGAPTFFDASLWRTALGLGTAAVQSYDAGTWTPTISYQTPGSGTVAYAVQTGSYIKVGKLVYIDLFITFTPTLGTASGRVQITGIPFSFADGGRTGGQMAQVGGGWAGFTTAPFLTTNAATEANIGYGTTSTTLATVANLTGGASHTVAGSFIYNTP